MKTTTGIIRFFGYLALAAGLLVTSCTQEDQRIGSDKPTPGADGGERREVLLTLNNKLALHPGSTKAAPAAGGSSAGMTASRADMSTRTIATTAENAISTLDVYAFGSATEEGEYTFLERFAYRAEANDPFPAGATELQLAVQGTNGDMTTGLLKLKRGLFVKLYCIANDTMLIDPAGDGVTPVLSTAFVPLKMSDPAEGNVTVTTPGIPQVSLFSSYHTHLLTEAAKGDTLSTPLAMSGCLATAIDLTSLDNTSRLQASFKLTRLAARFDIVNDAKLSRFTLQSVSMGNGRRGSGYFPIRVYGDLPTAKPTELITYPVRTFYGAGANTGLTPGAFYSYPAPQGDKGFLILKGLYKANETENKEVTYQIPFRQKTANGQEILLDITANHRYTLSITEADAYHLDVTIQVADWADDGSLDYTPDNKLGDLVVTIPPGYADESQYDEAKKTVSMSVEDGSTFEFSITTNSSMTLNKVYAGGINGQMYDWLAVSKPTVTSEGVLSVYTYTVSLTTPYLQNRYPRAALRMTNAIDGSDKVLYVESVSALAAIETPQPPKAPNGTSKNPNSFDAMAQTASLYRITGSRAEVNINSLDGIEIDRKPDWLDVAVSTQVGTVTACTLTLNNRDVEVADNSGTVTFYNPKTPDQKVDVTVLLLPAAVVPSYSGIGEGNTVTPGSGSTPDNLTFAMKKDNKTTVIASSLDGVSVKITYPEGSPEWLTFSGADATKSGTAAVMNSVLPGKDKPDNYVTKSTGTRVENILFTPIESKLGGAKTATITMTNIIGGEDKQITVTPEFAVPSLALSGTPVPSQNTLTADATASVVKLYRIADSNIQLKATAMGGTKVVDPVGVTVALNTGGSEFNADNIYTITWDGVTTTNGSFRIVNSSDNSKVQAVTVELPATLITVNADNKVDAANNVTTNIPVNSPDGCNIELLGNWGTDAGAGPWFTFPASLPAGDQNLTVTQGDNTNTLMKAVTLRITNVSGVGHKDITVTPVNFQKPTLSATSGSANLGYKNEGPITTASFTMTLPVGAIGPLIIEDKNIASVSIDGFIATVTGKNPGTTTIKVPNYSSPDVFETYTITVKDAHYNGAAVWKYNGFYIAPEDAAKSPWNEFLTATYCSNKTGGKWHVPSLEEWRIIVDCPNEFDPSTNVALYNELKSRGVFTAPGVYWSDNGNPVAAWDMYFPEGHMRISQDPSTSPLSIRCVSKAEK